MTYLEAAIQILKEAGQPLHYAEITKRALEKALIEPKGKTPDATMGAQLYMAAKDEGGGTGPRIKATGRAHFASVAQACGVVEMSGKQWVLAPTLASV